ncbi:hypothetical protein L9F63_026185, partial [Diploptera punctata]
FKSVGVSLSLCSICIIRYSRAVGKMFSCDDASPDSILFFKLWCTWSKCTAKCYCEIVESTSADAVNCKPLILFYGPVVRPNTGGRFVKSTSVDILCGTLGMLLHSDAEK